MKKIYLSGFCALLLSGTFAQSPGGVSTGLTLWLKADASSTLTSSDSLDSWQYSNNAKVFNATVSRPLVVPNQFNFLPGVSFFGNQYMDGPTLAGAPITAGKDDYAVFAVWTSNSSASIQRIWSQNGFAFGNNNGTSLWLYNGQWGDQAEIGPSFVTGMGRNYTIGAPYISQMNLLAQNDNDLELIDQGNLTAPTVLSTSPGNAIATRALAADYNRLGIRTYPSSEAFIGSLGELIVYNNSVDAGANRNKIFSYLSLKYGIPLGTDLIASDGSTIWNSAVNPYNNAVFGIGRDNTSGLLVTQSNSASTGNGSGGGQSGAANVVLSNPSALTTDLNFLTVGNDNGATTESTTGAPASMSILGRKWKAQHVGNVGTVNLSIDYTGVTTQGTLGNPNNFRLLVDASGTGDFTAGTITRYTPASFSGNIVNYTGVTLSNGAVFTFGSSATPLPVNWVSFTATPSNSDIVLKWTVTNNQQASGYVIEQSTDGVHFETIGQLANNPQVVSYSFTYSQATPGTHYFRILETDLDGQAIYSKTVAASIKASPFKIVLLGNPLQTNNVELRVTAAAASKAYFELWSLSGVKVVSVDRVLSVGVNSVSVPVGNLAAGSYILKLRAGDDVLNQQVIKCK
ncbi:T9SS type A sorting domain-containing protein [Flavitalea sp. BT771]|uniref:T9SS type A sorting domain-containing protein n=1 Tax=Flavitalea sp. BT771 TaxID=3063329 RepID=UPI0026E1FA0A|nr:T9SS type A sorting domain-containing protein [Flavitalea sp. BT771]MDO6435054.1 T9SS type A sorting domain-containing protein [Flavitalea sp. BT771]MDV6223954.1 T9SS type A sorting domain-containing protein [Flavitalea sp. BT771]